MEPLVVLGLLVILAVVAPRRGRNSRDGVRSREQELAAAGFHWPDRAEGGVE